MSIKKYVYILLAVLIVGGMFLFQVSYCGLGRQYGAGPRPDRILLSWVADPATSVAVTWRCRVGAGQGKVQVAKSTKGPDLERHIREVIAIKEKSTIADWPANYYSVNINGLEPETTYAYRVGNDRQWSEWNYLTTASQASKPFCFIFMGDIQDDIRNMWSRVIRKAYSDASDAAFILYAGDIVSKRKDSEWGQWFDATGFIHRMIPCLASAGNHEYAKGKLSDHWRKIFHFPPNGPIGLTDTTYYIDYQDVRIIILDSNAEKASQKKWLRKILEDNPNQWTIVAFHHPLYFVSKSRDITKPRNTWLPIFDEFGVDLVLQGHDHAYMRTDLVNLADRQKLDSVKSSQDEGTIYVVSVSGPKMYHSDLKSVVVKSAAGNAQFYQVIKINGNKLYFETKAADGKRYDAFTLTKQANGKKELADAIPFQPSKPGE